MFFMSLSSLRTPSTPAPLAVTPSLAFYFSAETSQLVRYAYANVFAHVMLLVDEGIEHTTWGGLLARHLHTCDVSRQVINLL